MLILLALLRSRRTLAAVLACALVPARARDRSRPPRLPAAEPAPARGQLGARLRDVPAARPRPRASCSRGGRPRGRRASRRWRTTSRSASSCASAARAEHRNLLLDMAGTRYGLEDVAGYDPVQLLAYRDAIDASNGNPQPDRHFLWVEVAPKRLLRELGVRYYVAQDGQVLRKLKVVLRTPTATVAARRQGAADRARSTARGATDAGAHRRARARPRRRRDARRAGGQARPGRSALSGLVGDGRREARDRARPARALPRRRPARRAPTASSGASQPREREARARSSRSRRSSPRSRTSSTRVARARCGRRLSCRRQRSASTSGARPSASSAGGALGQIESATTRPLAASTAISARMRSTSQPPGAGKPASGVRLGSSTSVSTCT